MKIDLVLWVLLLLVLAGSFTHTAWLFSLREQSTGAWWLMAWVLALGVDAGIAGAVAAIRLRRRAKRPAGLLWVVLTLCIAVSIYANLAHAVAVDSQGEPSMRTLAQIDPLQLATSALVSVPLPLLTLALAETVADDVATAQKEEEDARARAEKEEALLKARAEREAERGSAMQLAQDLNIGLDRARRVQRALALLSAEPAPSLREAAQAVGMAESTLRGYVGRLREQAPEAEEA